MCVGVGVLGLEVCECMSRVFIGALVVCLGSGLGLSRLLVRLPCRVLSLGTSVSWCLEPHLRRALHSCEKFSGERLLTGVPRDRQNPIVRCGNGSTKARGRERGDDGESQKAKARE